MTKREMFQNLANLHADDEEIVAFCNHEIELLNGRASHKTPTKNQKENEVIMANILTVLQGLPEPVTVTELIASDESLAPLTNQKVSALLRKLVNDGSVTKTMEKGKARFSA